MGRKRKPSRSNILLSFITGPLILTLFILKRLGDFLILLGRIHLSFWIVAYKIFLTIIDLLSFPVRFLFRKPFFSFKKRRIVYQRLLIYFPKIKFPKIRIPFIYKIKRKLNRETVALFFLKLKYFFLGALLVAFIALYYQTNQLVKSLPTPDYLTKRDISATTKIYDRNGKFLYEIYANENRTPLKLSEVPDIVKKATIAIEDKDFYYHRGYSPQGIVRAFLYNLNSTNIQGGSTITQQLVRSALLSPEKTWKRKLKELLLSIRTEQLYTKDQILEMYLNQVPYGGTAWGIEAAAQTYFGKSVANLNLAEAALLAGLPASPTTYSPFGENPTLSITRQKEVLNKMRDNNFISDEDLKKAVETTLTFKKPYIPIQAPHFVMFVKNMLEEEYGPRLVSQGGLRVITSLDLDLQNEIQKIVSSQIDGLTGLHVTNGAALVTNPQTGDILAMVGSKDYFTTEIDGNVNLTTSLRQPGSSIKVVNYAVSLENGFTANSLISDTPVTFVNPFGFSYSPVNYDGRFHGLVTLRTALGSSYNVPAVKVLNTIGVDKMIDKGRQMGITTWDNNTPYGLSLTLGGGNVTMVDMAKVYGALANGGVKKELTPFLKITDWTGREIPLPDKNSGTRAISSGIAFIISDILADNSARTPAFGPNSALVIPGKYVSVKTGTSDNKRDNWTIGYTPDYVAAVWVGNNDNSPMNPALTSGVTGAAPIWHEIINKLLQNKDLKPVQIPSDVVTVLCKGKREYFIKGTESKFGCNILPNFQLSETGSPSATPASKKP